MLTYTIYQLLAALCPTMKSGQIDHCIPLLLEVRTAVCVCVCVCVY